jgi:hypothetical protein
MEDHGYPVPSLSDSGELLKPAGYEATLPDEDAVNGEIGAVGVPLLTCYEGGKEGLA